MSYDLRFEIAPELYRRAITTPIDGAPPQRRVILQNIAAAMLFPLSIFGFNRAFFAPESLLPMLFSSCLGAAMVLAVWWRQHGKLVSVHREFNNTGGAQHIKIDAGGIYASRQYIRSEIDWPFIRAIRRIEGATLIELPTARLIVPDICLPDDVAPATFLQDLEGWRTA